MNILIPFEIKSRPIKKLVILDLKNDEKYKYLELQYFDGEPYGKGYRVMGLRYDGFLDVYNDCSLKIIPEEKINEVDKGALNWCSVDLQDTIFEDTNEGLRVFFHFQDNYGRKVVIDIEEHRVKPTRNMSLLGPTVAASENPLFLPLFWVNNFDFLYQKGTISRSKVDGEELEFAKPPKFPKDGQDRFFVKYSMNSYIIDFAPQQNEILSTYSLDENDSVCIGDTIYRFIKCNDEILLSSIEISIENKRFLFEIEGGLAVTDGKNIEFKKVFKFIAPKELGSIEGVIWGQRENHIMKYSLCPIKGWKANPVSIWDYLVMNRFTIHAKWPKTFLYTQMIDLCSNKSESKWERIRGEKNGK